MQFPISNIDLGTHDIMERQTDLYRQLYKENTNGYRKRSKRLK